jgi:WD40 repeat protein/DNA-binding SARP family transcriptional activator
MAASRLEFRILGPLAVRVDGESVPIGGPKQRALLALLLLSANRVVSRDRLIGELHADHSLNSADHALRNQVSRLRKVLSPVATDEPRLVARAPGYLLRVEPGELDLEEFERLVAEGRESLGAGDPVGAAESFHDAEALWHGRPLADLELEPFARVDVERLEELYLAAVEERIDADLALGRHRALVPELEALAVEHPYRERLRAQLMLALYRCGRQADGLEVYRRTRAVLSDELGLDPGVELQELERAILLQDPALNVAVDGNGSARVPLREVCPFKGLAPFEAADAEFFFGRERLVDELVARLADAPLLVVVGPSGSGKSSLLRAGLLPALDQESLVVRPGGRTAAELAPVFERIPSGQRFVLAVDQFEELFGASVAEEERRAFVDVLVEEAWNPDRRALILIALRADFFGRLAPYVELADLVGPNHVLLGPMSGTELRRAIEGPAERTGLEVEPALTDMLVDEVAGEAGGLPLLSTALLDLWHRRENGLLTVLAHERTGGVRGAVGRHAEAAFRSLGEEDREVARRILLRLIAAGEGEALTRRRVTHDELDADRDERVVRVLGALVEHRLLVADDGTVELVHEALLERWPRLAAWLEEDAQGRLVHRHLTQAAGGWDAAGRDDAELYRGARLTGAIEWADEHETELNQLEREFLAASRAASEREAVRQRRANRRLRGLLLVALALLVLSAVAGVVAWQKRSQARHNATVAEAQRLGAQALSDPSLDRALLLAREAVNLDDSSTTRSNLLATLLRSPAAIGVAHADSARLLDEALSPDGRVLAVRGDDGNVAFFDANTLRPIGSSFKGNSQVGVVGAVPGPLHALAFSPDGKTLAVGGSDGNSSTIDIFRMATHRPTRSTNSSGLEIGDVAFAPDGRTFATSEPLNGTSHPPPVLIVVRDARTGFARPETAEIRGGRLAGYTRDGRFLVVTSGPRRSLLLDAGTLKRARTFPVGGATALSPAANEAAFGHADGSVTLLDLHTGKTSTLPGGASGSVETVSFSRDGRTLATGADDGSVAVWRVRTGLLEAFEGHSAPVRAVVFSRDGRTLYSVGYDGSLIAWNVSGAWWLGRPFRYTFHPPSNGAPAESAVSPDGSLFAVSPRPDRVTLWRSATRTPLAPLLRGPTGPVNGLAFSGDGRLVAAAGEVHIVLWDTTTRKVVRIVEGGASKVAFSPDGHTLATGEIDGSEVLYDLRTGRRTGEVSAGLASTDGIDFSPDGKLLASASLNGTVSLWNVAAQTKVRDLVGMVAAYAVRFSPDGKLVAGCGSSSRVILWDAATGKRAGEPIAGHGCAIDFDPSGKTLATVGDDGKLRLWDVVTRKLIGAPLPGSTAGGSVHFFPDGKHVLGVFESGQAIIWNVDPLAWEARACSVARRNLSRAEWAEFLGHRGYRHVCP